MNKLSNIVVSLCLALAMIGASVIITLNIRDIYYNDIDKLNIESMSGLSREEIIENYDYLIDYNLSSNVGEFKLPTLTSSKPGKIHFEEVKDIFQNVKLLTIICNGVSFEVILISNDKSIVSVWAKEASIICVIVAAIGLDSTNT